MAQDYQQSLIQVLHTVLLNIAQSAFDKKLSLPIHCQCSLRDELYLQMGVDAHHHHLVLLDHFDVLQSPADWKILMRIKH